MSFLSLMLQEMRYLCLLLVLPNYSVLQLGNKYVLYNDWLCLNKSLMWVHLWDTLLLHIKLFLSYPSWCQRSSDMLFLYVQLGPSLLYLISEMHIWSSSSLLFLHLTIMYYHYQHQCALLVLHPHVLQGQISCCLFQQATYLSLLIIRSLFLVTFWTHHWNEESF